MQRRAVTSWIVFWTGLSAALGWGWMSHQQRDVGTGKQPVDQVKAQRSTSVPTRAVRTVSKESQLTRREVVLMGTQLVLVVETDNSQAVEAIQAAADRLRELEKEISSWRPDSDISRLNARAGVGPVVVGKDAFSLLKLSLELHELTDGAFDVTIGPVWDLWPFRDNTLPLPQESALANALKLVDASVIKLDEGERSAYLPMRGMQVNLGAIGKGYAARIAIDTIRNHGIKRAAVSAGGDLYLLGRRSDGPWVVGLEHPRWTGRVTERFVAGDIAVATSGNSQRFTVRDNRVFGHILDPRTGRPAEECQSVTVLTADPVRADAFATAVFVMGPEKGLEWAEGQPDVETLIIDRNGHQYRSSGWSQIAKPISGRSTVAQLPITGAADLPDMRTRTTRKSSLGELNERSPEANLGEMVMVPAGEFLSGDDRVRLELSEFQIDRTEVTNAQYRQFLDATVADPHEFCHPDEPADKDHTPRYCREFRSPLFRSSPAAQLAPFSKDTFRKPDHPVVGVDWWDAWAFARWAGKRLPTRHEWEKAARGTDGRVWPWGDNWDFSLANGGGEKWGEHDGHTYAAPSISFNAGVSTCGCLNMAGNVAEWTDEGFVAGGSSNSNPSQMRCAAGRLREPGFRAFDIGFRCARSGRGEQ